MALEDDQDVTMHGQRFMDVVDEPSRILPPIQGFEKMPQVSLEEAVKPLALLVPGVEENALLAKRKCTNPPADGLSIDESASIRLYTMEMTLPDVCLYVVLNETLRTEDREVLKPWFLYLRLIIGSLLKIPSTRRHIFRGVKRNLWQQHVKGQKTVWWAFNSCTGLLKVLESGKFLGTKGDRTLFDIDSYSGKDIRQHSHYSKESEILLLPATQFQIVGSLDSGNGLHVIHLKEIETQVPLLAKISPAKPSSLPLKDEGKSPPFADLSGTNTAGPKKPSFPKVISGSTTLEKRDLSKKGLTDKDLLPLANELLDNETISVVQWKCCGIEKKKVRE
jgi:hypothetical protein